ncbi:MAG: universal stress protein [Maricaulaceae bacterium]|jgi:nucleotide-binding universal stress UspA family protein
MARHAIYVPLSGGAEDCEALEAARALAPLYDAEVRAAFIGRDDAALLMVAGDGVAGFGAAAAQSLREAREQAAKDAEAAAQEFGAAYERMDGPRGGATAPARLAALAVADSRSARGDGLLTDVFQTLLLEDGAPVFVPRGKPAFEIVAAAWDGSREAARALKAAAPILAQAKEIHIVQAPRDVEAADAAIADPAHARGWIAGRAPNARIELVTTEGGDGKALVDAAKSGGGADLLIAGAYGHARLREAVFGGATRSMLGSDGLSLLLAH